MVMHAENAEGSSRDVNRLSYFLCVTSQFVPHSKIAVDGRAFLRGFAHALCPYP